MEAAHADETSGEFANKSACAHTLHSHHITFNVLIAVTQTIRVQYDPVLSQKTTHHTCCFVRIGSHGSLATRMALGTSWIVWDSVVCDALLYLASPYGS
jgi:hypothetical protein